MKNVIYLLLFGLLALPACNEENPAKVETQISNDPLVERELELLNQEIKSNPESPDGYHRRHQYFIKQGQYDKAREDLNLCISMDPNRAIFYHDKADLLFNLGEFEGSLVYADTAIVMDSSYKQSHVLQGRIYMGVPNYGKAIDAFNRALRIDKFYPEPYFYKGLSYARAGDTLKAVSSLITATEQNSEYYDPYMELGLIYAEHDGVDRERALLYFNNALDIEPNSIEALLAKGVYLQNNAGPDLADSCYRRILELEPQFEVAYHNMGYCHLMQYKNEETKEYNDSVLVLAIEDFTSAIEINPNYTDAYFNRGVAYEFLGEPITAKTDYATAYKLDPNWNKAKEARDAL